MAKVTFHYDYKKDAWSWVLIAKDKKNLWGLNWKQQVSFIPESLLKQILRSNKKVAESLVQNYLKTRPKKNIRRIIMKEQLICIEKVWRKIEKIFLKRLEKITQKPIFAKKIKCYPTTGFMCPYDQKNNFFMISLWHNIPSNIATICHEILHLQFLYHYEKYCRKTLSKEKLEDLKEALTFILNSDFSDLLLIEDRGYPAHQKLRREFKKVWLQDKNFNRFLDKIIKIVGEKK